MIGTEQAVLSSSKSAHRLAIVSSCAKQASKCRHGRLDAAALVFALTSGCTHRDSSAVSLVDSGRRPPAVIMLIRRHVQQLAWEGNFVQQEAACNDLHFRLLPSLGSQPIRTDVNGAVTQQMNQQLRTVGLQQFLS